MERIAPSPPRPFVALALAAWALFSILASAPVQAAGGGSPAIGRISLSTDGTALFVDLTLQHGFTKEVLEGLQSGLRLIFSYELELVRPRLIKDSEVARVRVERTINYDPLRDEYHIVHGASPVFVTVKGLERAEAEVSRLHVRLVSVDRLQWGQLYRLRVRASVRKVETGLRLGRMLGIFSRWGYQTPWKIMEFSY